MRAPVLAQIIGAVSLATVFGPAREARAQGASNEAAAQALFDEAVKLMDQGNYAAACPKLASSESLDHAAGTLFDLAGCYEKIGRVASAWATFQDAANAATSGGRPDWAARARQRASALEAKLAWITIVVPPATASTGRVVLDAVVLDASANGVPIPADPGSHAIAASAPGKRSWTTTVQLGAAQRTTVTVPPLEDATAGAPSSSPVSSPSPVAPEPRDHGASFWTTRRLAGLGMMGAGLVGVGLGAAFAVASKSAYDDALAHDCGGAAAGCTPTGVERGQRAYALADGSTLAVTSGAVCFGLGALLFALAGPRASPVTTASLSIQPVLRPGTLGAGASGTW